MTATARSHGTPPTRLSPDEIKAIAGGVDLVGLIVRHGVKLVKAAAAWEGLCPFHAERTPSFKVMPDKGYYHCFGCGAHGDAIAFVMEMQGLSFMEAIDRLSSGRRPDKAAIELNRERQRARDEAADHKAARMHDIARKIWKATVPPHRTAAEGYLRGRGIQGPLPPTIRFHPRLQVWNEGEPTGRFWPAMVAAAQPPRGGPVMAVHITFLAQAQRVDMPPPRVQNSVCGGGWVKAPESRPKIMLGPCRTNVVRLDAPGRDLHLAEGIETAFAVRQLAQMVAHTPKPVVFAGLSSSLLTSVVPPPSVQRVWIWADRDKPNPKRADGMPAGELAARSLGGALAARGLDVHIVMPPLPDGVCGDFNDVLLNLVSA